MRLIRNSICANYLAYRPTIEDDWVKFNMDNMFCVQSEDEYVALYAVSFDRVRPIQV
jgi:hypothetical protein